MQLLLWPLLSVLYFGLRKKEWRRLFIFIIIALVLASPQIFLVKQLQTISFAFFNPGFLLAHGLTFQNFISYWFWNLGLSLVMIPFGIWYARGKRLFVIPVVLLFILPNIFQFSPQMFDNHKFFNMFIMFANIYIAYLLYTLFKKQFLLKLLAGILLFFYPK